MWGFAFSYAGLWHGHLRTGPQSLWDNTIRSLLNDADVIYNSTWKYNGKQVKDSEGPGQLMVVYQHSHGQI
jgi:hypothetical protein